MSREWRLFLVDAVGFCRNVMEFRGDLTRAQFESDRRTFDATVRNLELIGEALKNVPEAIQVAYPDIPWTKIISMRNILAHVYFGLDNDVVWDVVCNHVPVLLENLQRIERETSGAVDD